MGESKDDLCEVCGGSGQVSELWVMGRMAVHAKKRIQTSLRRINRLLVKVEKAIEAGAEPKEETHIEESPGPRCQNCRQNITWSGGSCRLGCAWFAGEDVVRCTFFEPKEEPC
jgi:hypothetical protein